MEVRPGPAAPDAKHLHLQVFNKVVLCIGDELILKGDRVVGVRIDEMVALRIAVAELKLMTADIHKLNLLGRRKTDVGRLSRVDVTDDCLNEGAQIPRSAVLNFEDDGWISVVTDRHAFAEIVCESHLEKTIRRIGSKGDMGLWRAVCRILEAILKVVRPESRPFRQTAKNSLLAVRALPECRTNCGFSSLCGKTLFSSGDSMRKRSLRIQARQSMLVSVTDASFNEQPAVLL